jgi:putative transposase
VARGNQKQNIFKDKNDYLFYLFLVRKAKRKYKILLYSYCLMSNHIHLLIESKLARNISKFMHWVNRGYTNYFNTKYSKVGHLWQGRFKSKPILKGEYLINCSNYIEGNPIRKRLVSNISNYPWSSYKERCLSSEKIFLDEMLSEGQVQS